MHDDASVIGRIGRYLSDKATVVYSTESLFLIRSLWKTRQYLGSKDPSTAPSFSVLGGSYGGVIFENLDGPLDRPNWQTYASCSWLEGAMTFHPRGRSSVQRSVKGQTQAQLRGLLMEDQKHRYGGAAHKCKCSKIRHGGYWHRWQEHWNLDCITSKLCCIALETRGLAWNIIHRRGMWHDGDVSLPNKNSMQDLPSHQLILIPSFPSAHIFTCTIPLSSYQSYECFSLSDQN